MMRHVLAELLKDPNIFISVNTHCHADHVTGTGILKTLVSCKSMISAQAGAKADVYLRDGDIIKFGEQVKTWLLFRHFYENEIKAQTLKHFLFPIRELREIYLFSIFYSFLKPGKPQGTLMVCINLITFDILILVELFLLLDILAGPKDAIEAICCIFVEQLHSLQQY